MPVPFPTAETVNLHPPDADEVRFMSRGMVSAMAPPGGITELQQALLDGIVHEMTGIPVPHDPEPIGPREYAEGLARRDEGFRTRMVQMMLLGALVLRPLPSVVADQVQAFAVELGVDERMLHVAREFAAWCSGSQSAT